MLGGSCCGGLKYEKTNYILRHKSTFLIGLHRILIWPDIRPIVLPDTGYPGAA